jgi:hypothetical protein
MDYELKDNGIRMPLKIGTDLALEVRIPMSNEQ